MTSQGMELAEALRTSDELLVTLLQASPDFIKIKDGAGCYLLANPAALQLFRLEEIGCVGLTDEELIPLAPDQKTALLTSLAADVHCWNACRPLRTEETFTFEDGTEHVYDVLRVPTYAPDGSRKRIIIMGREVTERRDAERALRQSESRYRNLFESAPIGMVVCSPEGRILDVNPVFCEWMQYTQEELTGMPLQQIAADPTLVAPNIERMAQGEALHVEVVNRRKDGALLNLELREIHIQLPDGSAAQLSVCINATEYHRARAEQQRLKRRIEELEEQHGVAE